MNRKAGARTQVAALVTAAVALATLLFLAPVIGAHTPGDARGRRDRVIRSGLSSPRRLREIRAFRTLEFRWALVACVGVVLLGTLKGILAAVILSMLSLLNWPTTLRST